MNTIESMIEILKPQFAWGQRSSKRETKLAPGGYTYCLLGALDKLLSDEEVIMYSVTLNTATLKPVSVVPGVINIIADTIREQYPEIDFAHSAHNNNGVIMNFNDMPGREKADVMQILEKAAIKLDEQV